MRLAKKYRLVYKQNGVENFAIGGRTEGRPSPVIHRTPCKGRGGVEDAAPYEILSVNPP